MFVLLRLQVLTVDEGAEVRAASIQGEEEQWSLRSCVAEVQKCQSGIKAMVSQKVS